MSTTEDPLAGVRLPPQEIVISEYRLLGQLRQCAPSTMTPDEDVFDLFVLVSAGFRQAAWRRGEVVDEAVLNAIALQLMQMAEKFGEAFAADHLLYEMEKYEREGFRSDHIEGRIALFHEPLLPRIAAHMAVCCQSAAFEVPLEGASPTQRVETILFCAAYLVNKMSQRLSDSNRTHFIRHFDYPLRETIKLHQIESHLTESLDRFIWKRMIFYGERLSQMYRSEVTQSQLHSALIVHPLNLEESFGSKDENDLRRMMIRISELIIWLETATDKILFGKDY